MQTNKKGKYFTNVVFFYHFFIKRLFHENFGLLIIVNRCVPIQHLKIEILYLHLQKMTKIMTPFLQQIATLFYEKYGTTIHRLAFVFPNQRSGLFFRKYLSQQTQKPLFSPTILTINELFLRLSDKQLADRIQMLFLLYRIYIRHSRKDESFDDFVFWGESLLNDFDDIDKYLVNAAHIFTNVRDIHQIDRKFSYLQPEQVEAIRRFWSTFRPPQTPPKEGRPPQAPPKEGLSSPPLGEVEGAFSGEVEGAEKSFIDIWQHLYAIYTDFRQELAAEGRGYDGMIFREVAEKISITNYELRITNRELFEKIIFVGLNALSPSEKELMRALQKQGIADFYWDCGPTPSISLEETPSNSPKGGELSPSLGGVGGGSVLLDAENKASFFIRENLKAFPSAYPLSEETYSWPEIELIGISSRIGQAKQVYPILKEMLAGRASPDPEEALQTAIVLPDERLLIPVLHSIPEEFLRINVTLGYPLSDTPIASLMETILNLQKKKRLIDNQPFFYHHEVLSLLNHQYITSACPEEVAFLINKITTHHSVFIPTSGLHASPLLAKIFQPVTEVCEITDYLIRILKELNRIITSHHSKTEKDEDEASDLEELDQEFVYHYFTMVNRLHDMVMDYEIQMTIDTFFRLLKRLTDSVTIPFYGKPLSGIQVMGVLETRVLDFERLIVLSMNEGIFPAKTTAGSFIPYNLRRGFGLPTYEHQDSVWAYHFYRMIARAKKVTMLYDTRTEGLQTGEVSRFVHQLKYQYGVQVNEKIVVSNISSTKPVALQIEKTAEVITKMMTYLTGGGKALSASSINTYIDCPLKFYFSAIEDLKEDEDVSESVDSREFGTLFHYVAELIYKPFYSSMVTADLLKSRVKPQILTEAIQRAFSKKFFLSEEVKPLSGQHYLTGEMIRKYVLKLIEKDCKLTPFRYISSEEKIQIPFRLTNGMEIQLKGLIDRIDAVDGKLRIVDYKTGKKQSHQLKSIESLFDPTDMIRQSAVLQVFLYAKMVLSSHPWWGEGAVQPALYYIRDLFANDFDSVIYLGKEKQPILDFSLFMDHFEDCIRICLDKLFNPEIPFTQATNTKLCIYCPFAKICGR